MEKPRQFFYLTGMKLAKTYCQKNAKFLQDKSCPESTFLKNILLGKGPRQVSLQRLAEK